MTTTQQLLDLPGIPKPSDSNGESSGQSMSTAGKPHNSTAGRFLFNYIFHVFSVKARSNLTKETYHSPKNEIVVREHL